jgi:imidazolonepropionase
MPRAASVARWPRRAATDDELRARLAGFVRELHAQGTTTFEVKTGYDLTVAGEALARLAAEVTDEVTFLGAHVVPAEYEHDRAAYVDLVCGPMLDAVRPFARWIDVFCETRRVHARRGGARPAGGRDGLGTRVHGNQLGTARARGSRPRWRGIRRPLHLPQRRGRRRSRGERRRRDAAARRRVLDAASLSRCAPADRRGRDRRARERLQPGHELHELDAAHGRARRPRDGHDGRRGRLGGDRGRCARPAPGRRRSPRRRRARRLVVLDAPTRTHLAYRPGVPLVRAVYAAERVA